MPSLFTSPKRRSPNAPRRAGAATALICGFFTASASGATSVFLDSSAAGNNAAVETPYGSSIYLIQPGINVNPAFKVEDGKANWSKDNLTGFNNSADMPPLPIHQLPVITYGGLYYIALGVDFNETGASSNFDIVNLMLWAGPESAGTLAVATLSDPSIGTLTWAGSVNNQTKNSWESGLRQMSANPASTSLGIDLIYQQNASPLLNVAGDALPYGSDPNRVYSNGLSSLGSNEADIAILVPYSVLVGRNSNDVIYLGLQTGSLADGGSDRVGFVDPASLVAGGYLQLQGAAINSSFVQPNTVITVPEPSGATLLMSAAAGCLLRRRRPRYEA
jgi:hypothetical protein